VANAANIFMAILDNPDEPEFGSRVVTSTMQQAHRAAAAAGLVQHEMKPAFHPMAIPNWRDCLTCTVCGFVLVTKAMFEQAPHWLKVYLAALALSDWLLVVPEIAEDVRAAE